MKKHQEILRMEQITLISGGTRILNNAKLNLFENEVIGIVGVNYAGKTALAGAIAGFSPCTSGRIHYLEKPLIVKNMAQAQKAGIFYIQPKSSLIEELTVAENLFFAPDKKSKIMVHHQRENQQARELLDSLHLTISETAVVQTLSHREKIIIEICKALANPGKIIILDTIISALPKISVPQFSALLQAICKKGISIILIEARARPLLPFCQRLVVIREGATAGIVPIEEYNEDKLVSLMIGREIQKDIDIPIETSHSTENVILQFQDIHYRHILHGLDFPIFTHEVMGILNVNKNSGRAIELLLSGQDIPDKGTFILQGSPMCFSSPEHTFQQGIAIVPEDDGLEDSLSLEDNILLSAVKKNSRFGVIQSSELRYLRNELLSDYLGEEYTYQPGLPLGDGWIHRKKVAFCRALASQPKLIVISNPTQRIDFLSRQKIYEDILQLKKQGITVLVISTNINELVSICERIAVVHEGQVREIFPVKENNKEHLLQKYGKYLKDV